MRLEKLTDRNGIAMLPRADDPLAAFEARGGARQHRGARAAAAARLARARAHRDGGGGRRRRRSTRSVFVVRYAGGDDGGPIEPVEILPAGLSLAEYDISFAAGAANLRVEHRLDGPVRCRAEPAAQKQVFTSTPVELYTQEIDRETHNIVQVYFSDLRDEVAVDVLNLTGTGLSLDADRVLRLPRRRGGRGAQL